MLIKSRTRKSCPPILWIVMSLSLLLSSCVKYDLGVNFHHTNGGEIIQHIQLDKKLTSFSGDYIQEWWKNLENLAHRLGGSAQRISQSEITVQVPFTNSQELQTKFNSFFHAPGAKKSNYDVNLPGIISNLLVEEQNFVLISRHHLIYDVDLRSLAPIINKNNNLTNTNTIVNLDFGLQTAWGMKNISSTENKLLPEKTTKQNIWQLQLGQLNHIEVVFWLPNFLGIGTLLIILFIWGGIYLKYQV
jgi:hypothetical protein